MKDTIKEYLAGQYDAYVKDLETLTNIDSGNGDLQGTEAANKFVAEKMQELGAVTEFRYNDRACHLISRLKGSGKLSILLVAMLTRYSTAVKRLNVLLRLMRMDLPGGLASVMTRLL